MRILLIEPDYKNKYPPLGLMKISTFHKQKGDTVFFYKGCSNELRSQIWDRVYISTLFTFHWNITIKTIKYYRNSVKNSKDIFVGGILASLLGDEIKSITKSSVIKGLLNKKGILGCKDDDQIDYLIPDYSILDHDTNPLTSNKYPTINSYFVHATRGCPNRCKFCAVPFLEPFFFNGLSIMKQIEGVKKEHLSNKPSGRKARKHLIEQLIARGYKRAEIAERLSVSIKTVYNILKS